MIWKDEIRGYRYLTQDEIEETEEIQARKCQPWRKNGKAASRRDVNGDMLLLFYLKFWLDIWWFRVCNPKFRPENWSVFRIYLRKWKES